MKRAAYRKQSCGRFSSCRGFTFVELTMVVLLICMLIALLLPAVQQAREQARKSQCRNNLVQIGFALTNYRMAHGVLPPGTVNDTGPIKSKEGGGYHMNWLVQILPFLEERNAYDKIDFTKPVYDEVQVSARGHALQLLQCPSTRTGGGRQPITCYFGVHNDIEAPIDVDQNGVLFLNSSINEDQIPDGDSHTIFLIEGRPDWGTGLGWMSGTRASLRNGVVAKRVSEPTFDSDGNLVNTTRIVYVHHASMSQNNDSMELKKELDALETQVEHVGGGGSHHSGGSHYLFGDGAVRFLDSSIDANLLRKLTHRADGELTSEY